MQFAHICFLSLTILPSCISEAGNREMTENFILDFFHAKHQRAYNIFGCWSQKNRKAFGHMAVKNEYFRNFYFHKEVHIQGGSFQWLTADAQFCNITQYLTEISKKNMFRLPNKHLLLISSNDYYYYIKISRSYRILPMSEVVLATFNATEVILYTIYKIRSDGHLITEPYGTWTAKGGLSTTFENVPFADRRKDFQKYPLKQGVVIFNQKDVLQSDFNDISRTSEFLFQQEMPILYSLHQSVNAEVEIKVYKTHGYGKLNKSTRKIAGDGMIQDLYEEKIDLTSAMFLTSERHGIYQPVAPINLLGLKFFLKKPSLSSVKNIYILTFSKSVWIATLLITAIFIGSLYISLNWEIRHKLKCKKNETVPLHRANISDMFLLSFEALCQQGTFIESFKISGRILLLLLFLMFMFIYVAYSANILVLLSSTSKISSLADLLDSRFEVGGLNQTYVKHYFQSPEHGILRKFYLKKIHPGKYFETIEGLKKVQEGNFAFFAPIVPSYNYFVRNFTNYDICALQELPGYMNMKAYPSVPKSSGYTEIFKVWLLNIQERGIAERSKVRMARKPHCNNQGGNFQPVRIFDCLSVILIFGYGIAISVFVLFIEILVKYYLNLICDDQAKYY